MEELASLVTLSELWRYLTLGAAAGLMAGLLGVGGGLIIVPVLMWIFRHNGFDESLVLHLALGTSLGTIVFTSISSVRAHHRRGAVRWRLVARLAPGIVIGAWLGAAVADALNTQWLQRVFGTFAVVVSVQMFLSARAEGSRDLPGAGGMTLAGGLIGAVSGIVGIGGGSLTVPFLTWCRVSIREAVATSSACGLPIALAGALGYVAMGLDNAALPSGSTGYLYWPALIGVALVSVLTAPLGAHLTHTLPVGMLKKIFSLLLLVIGVKLLWG